MMSRRAFKTPHRGAPTTPPSFAGGIDDRPGTGRADTIGHVEGRPTSEAGAAALTTGDRGPSLRMRDLIASSTFETSAGFDFLEPSVSIILPTFRRGDNGMLRSCINSVLAQGHADFELIIIDDGSTDSTRSIIEEFLASDPRIATIRHPKNVGLPGLSCNEAILRARAERIFFTFDDNTLEPDALETMLDAAHAHPDAHFYYAEVFSPYPGHDRIEGAGEFSRARLYEQNFIPNGAVLLDRFVLERCGLYDPHILITRLCDWDLWLRIAAEFEPLHIDRIIATENGRTQPDSLGNSHAWDPAVVEEWLATDRVAKLRPEAILEYDVASAPDTLSEISKAKITSFIDRFFIPPQLRTTAEAGYLVVLCDQFTEEVQELLIRNSEHVRVVPITYFQFQVVPLWDLLIAARRVIFAGDVAGAEEIASRLRSVAKPYDYFLPTAASEVLDAGSASADTFISGIEHFIRRNPEDDSRSANAGPIVMQFASPSRIQHESHGTEWTETTLRGIFDAHRQPDTIEIMGKLNGLIRTAPQTVLEVVPEGYLTSEEYKERILRQLRRRPFSILRSLTSGVRAGSPKKR